MDGQETYEELKKIRADIPIILSSGYGEMEATRRFAGKDIAGFIQKPYTAEQLAGMVKATTSGVSSQ